MHAVQHHDPPEEAEVVAAAPPPPAVSQGTFAVSRKEELQSSMTSLYDQSMYGWRICWNQLEGRPVGSFSRKGTH